MKNHLLLVLSFVSISLFANQFSIEEESLGLSSIIFNVGEYSIDLKDSYNSITSNSKGETQNYGEPLLPTYSFNYGVERDKEYEVSFEIVEYETYQNINLYPVQPVKKNTNDQEFVKNENLYNSNSKYPLTKLNVSRKSMRGYELLGVELIPFDYDFKNKNLTVYTSIKINIKEIETRQSNSTPRSEIFEKMYNNMTINSALYTDDRNFQKPSILYIMEDYTSVIEPLVEWRRRQGFEVTVVDRDQTGSSTTSIKNYIENAYDNWNNPPEFVCLVGDADGSLEVNTFNVGEGGSWWGAYGEGDFPYTLLEGNDFLPDIIIGRISVRSTSSLATVVNKIIGYEKNYAGTSSWLRSAALVGDPSDSGISTVITNEYIEEIIDIHGGITDVRTKYSGGGYDTFMRDQINDGVSYLNYRGFYGFSNFTTSDVDQLNNGFKLPFLTTLTCDTGSFSTDNECITEALFRAGSSANPKGAIAVIGTAQPYTHTAFNNIVTMGIYEGIFIDKVKTAGEALVYGQLALSEIYPQNPNNNVYYFATWNNLMGDPATQLWTSTPQALNVLHNEYLIQGSNNFQVFVTDQFDEPYANAMVTLYKPGNNGIQLNAYTNENGIADFEVNSYINGDIYVTTRCQNCTPVETEFEITDDLPELILNQNSIEIDDLNGNDDAIFNPGETIDISFQIQNLSIQQVDNIYATISSGSSYINIENHEVYVGNLSPAGTLEVQGLSVTALSSMSNGETPDLRIELKNESENLYWSYMLPVSFISGEIELSHYITNDNNNNGILERGETGLLNLTVSNVGLIPLNQLTANLDYSGGSLNISNEQLNFSNINIGSSQTLHNIQVSASDIAIHGSMISIPLYFSTNNGFTSEQVMQIQIGELTVHDPMGPDSYGYYIYDMNDYEYQLAPEYDWIEIDPDYGGSGNLIGVYDNGDNGDDVETVDLPFTFTFYGQDYNEVSICSNGWISFGQTDMRSFRNYTLPGPGGPSPIVAVFWDDLETTNTGDVYTYYDQQMNAFIVEWSEMRTFYNNTLETFQIILYDNGWQTPTGDDEMKLQFKEFNNNSYGDYPVGNYDGAVIHGQYCTVGIENHLQSDGLQYTFNNVYHQSAMTLSDETALYITTRTEFDFAQPSIDLSEDSFNIDIEPGGSSSVEFELSNTGEENSMLYYSLGVSPFNSSLDQLDEFGYAWTDDQSDVELDYNWIDIEDDNSVLQFDSTDGVSLISLGWNFPFYENSYGLLAVMANGWVSFDASGSEEENNGSIFDNDSPQCSIFGFWDDLDPSNYEDSNGDGVVRYHTNSDRVVVWYDNVPHEDYFGLYDFQIVLYRTGEIVINYREMSGFLSSATVGILDPQSEYGLEVIYNQDNFIEDEMSVFFDTAPSWLTITSNNITGNIYQGSSQTISLDINVTDSMAGIYKAYIPINSNAYNEPSISIPFILSVSVLSGDINFDEVINILDVVQLVNFVLGIMDPEVNQINVSDMNSDGTLNIQDIIILMNIILNQ